MLGSCLGAEAVLLRIWYLRDCSAVAESGSDDPQSSKLERLVSCWGLSTSGEVITGGSLNGTQIVLMQSYFSVVNITELLV